MPCCNICSPLRLRDHGTEGENQHPWDVPDNKNEMFLTGFMERLIFHKLIYFYIHICMWVLCEILFAMILQRIYTRCKAFNLE